MKTMSRRVFSSLVPLATLAILACVGLLMGCSSTPDAPSVQPWTSDEVITFKARTNDTFLRRAVIVGLTSVDAGKYNGWSGDCPGCDVDAQTFALMCDARGVEHKLLLNDGATLDRTLATAKAAYSGMRSGDLLVIYISGHGGQQTDSNGDEDDGKDETLCLYDGQLNDDLLGIMFMEIPTGVRVFYVTDTCNSGSNYKLQPRSIPRTMAAQLIHYGGCADGASSYGTEQGGTFTTALVDAWQDSNTYKGWFQKAYLLMPKNQDAVYAEWNVSDEFRNMEALR